MEAFDTLPFCAIAANDYFCMHAGIGPEIKTIMELQKLERFLEIPHSGIICDMTWADPAPDEVAVEQ